MNIRYILDHNDFLNFQLFTTSTLEAAKKRRRKIRVFTPMIYLALGFWLYFKDKEQNYKLTIFLIIFAVLWYFIFPFFEAKSYKKKLMKYIMTHYKDTLPMSVDMELENESLYSKGLEEKNRIFYKDFEDLKETDQYLFVKIENTGQTLIFPKEKISNHEELSNHLKAIAQKQNLPYTNYGDWKWK